MEFFLRKVYPWLIEVSSFSICIPLLVGVFLITKRESLLFRLLLLYTGFIALSELVGQLTIYLGTKNNLWVSHLDTPIEFALAAVIYHYSLNQPLLRRGVIVSIACVFVFSLINVIWVEDLTQMNSLPRMLSAVLLISMAVLYFYQMATEPHYTYLERDPMFLLSCGIIIHQAGTAVAYSMFNRALAESYDTARMCITVILLLNIFFRVTLMMALRRTS